MTGVARFVLLLLLTAGPAGACGDRRGSDDRSASATPEPAAFIADETSTTTVASTPSSQEADSPSTTAASETTSTTSVAAEASATAPRAPALTAADIAALQDELDAIDALLNDIDVAMTEDELMVRTAAR